MDHVENTIHCCTAIVSMGTCLSAKPLLSNGSTCYIAPTLRLFIPNNLPAYRYFLFSEGCACDVSDQSHLPSLWLSSQGDYSPTAPAAPTLKPLIPSSSVIRRQLVQVYYHHPSFLLSAGKRSESGRCSYISSYYFVCSLFFHFRGS
jgi:hypothetical protein